MERQVTYGPETAAVYEMILFILRGLLEEKLFLDCCLVAGGQSIKCHRLILAAVSPKLRVLLQNNKKATLIFDSMKFVNLKCMIEYIYNGSTQLLPEEVADFEKTLKYFQLDIGEVRRRGSHSKESRSAHNRSPTHKLPLPIMAAPIKAEPMNSLAQPRMSTSSDDSTSSDSSSPDDSLRTSRKVPRRRNRSSSFSSGDSWKSDSQFLNRNLIKLKPSNEDSNRSTNGRVEMAQDEDQTNDKNVETQNDTRGGQAEKSFKLGLKIFAPTARTSIPRGQAMRGRARPARAMRDRAHINNKDL